MHSLRIDVWSDIACPWCFVGKRRLEVALEQFEGRASVELVWRAFELDPSAPAVRPRESDYVARLARKYRVSEPQAQEFIDRMVQSAADEGLAFDFDHIRPGNTFDAHRLLHLAHERGCQDALKERLLAGYLEQGEPIGDHDFLRRAAADVGLDAHESSRLLDSQRYADEVRRDEAEAAAIGVSGVPFFVLDGKYAVSGAQPAEVLLAVLRKVAALRSAGDEALGGAVAGDTAADDGAACTPSGCP
jgi:predicted DsbA family dithiol-disulfide isomerase